MDGPDPEPQPGPPPPAAAPPAAPLAAPPAAQPQQAAAAAQQQPEAVATYGGYELPAFIAGTLADTFATMQQAAASRRSPPATAPSPQHDEAGASADAEPGHGEAGSDAEADSAGEGAGEDVTSSYGYDVPPLLATAVSELAHTLGSPFMSRPRSRTHPLPIPPGGGAGAQAPRAAAESLFGSLHSRRSDSPSQSLVEAVLGAASSLQNQMLRRSTSARAGRRASDAGRQPRSGSDAESSDDGFVGDDEQDDDDGRDGLDTFAYDEVPPTLNPAIRMLSHRVRQAVASTSPPSLDLNLAHAANRLATEAKNAFARTSLARGADTERARGPPRQTPQHLDQFVDEVLNFSSQYGLNSYAADNLVGIRRIYPRYGDFSQALVLRTYGPWWLASCSAAPPLFGRTHNMGVRAGDFVEVAFQVPVWPCKISIFETYNPGTVVRISCLPSVGDIKPDSCTWFVLWSGKAASDIKGSNDFSPTLRHPPFLTNQIRIEFDHTSADYYSEFDAVQLSGWTQVPKSHRRRPPPPPPAVIPAPSDVGVLADAAEPGAPDTAVPAPESSLDESPFDLLPDELLFVVFDLLTLPEALMLALTCERFYQIGLYLFHGFEELDLQPDWLGVNNSLLMEASQRLRGVRKLSLSWSGCERPRAELKDTISPIRAIQDAASSPSIVTTPLLNRFLRLSCSNLVCIRLASCSYVTAVTLDLIVDVAPGLEELDLQNCGKIPVPAFGRLGSLTKLQRLNLHNTWIDRESLYPICRSNKNLQHLNLGHCINLMTSIDLVVASLAEHCHELRSLDLWRARGLNTQAVRMLAVCKHLEELDIGWCRDVDVDQCIPYLAQQCPKLRKIFVTASRLTSNDCLHKLADSAPGLEQLDILGSSVVTQSGVAYLLKRCTSLRLLDVSFCSKITQADVVAWRAEYPALSIKKSFLG